MLCEYVTIFSTTNGFIGDDDKFFLTYMGCTKGLRKVNFCGNFKNILFLFFKIKLIKFKKNRMNALDFHDSQKIQERNKNITPRVSTVLRLHTPHCKFHFHRLCVNFSLSASPSHFTSILKSM